MTAGDNRQAEGKEDRKPVTTSKRPRMTARTHRHVTQIIADQPQGSKEKSIFRFCPLLSPLSSLCSPLSSLLFPLSPFTFHLSPPPFFFSPKLPMSLDQTTVGLRLKLWLIKYARPQRMRSAAAGAYTIRSVAKSAIIPLSSTATGL